MIEHVINQTRHSSLIDDLVIATTISKEDDIIEKFCKKNKIKLFRGSENDVLDRYYQCAKKYNADVIIRITSDCPFIDPDIVDKGIRLFFQNKVDYIGNNIAKKNGVWDNDTCNYPQGNTVEVCSFSTMEKAWRLAQKPSEREHVFPFVQFNPQIFKIKNFSNNKDLSYIRCTVDHVNDLKFIRQIYKKIIENKQLIKTHDILNVVQKNPHLLGLNNKIPFDEGYKISLKKDIDQKIISRKKKIKKIILMVDGNAEIGLGHFYRMINLAKSLSKNNHVTFMTNNKSELLRLENKFKIESIPKGKIGAFEKKLNQLKPDVIIIDKHRENNVNLGIMKRSCNYLLSIDYVGKNVNHISKNFGILYQNKHIEQNTTFEYSLLNKNITKQKPIQITKKIHNIVVLQGGSDTHCFTPKIIDALHDLSNEIQISVVLGPSFLCHNEIKKILVKLERKITITNNIKNMGSFLKNFDLAITAGGMTLLELAYLGIPSVIICGEKFENETAKKMEILGYGINLGFGKTVSKNKIYNTTKSLIADYSLRKKMNNNGKRIIDGKGLLRITEFIKSLD